MGYALEVVRFLAMLCCGLALTVGPLARAQYPSAPQIFKDGTAVVVEDYASLPLSSVTTGTYPPPINYASQLGRVNFLRSEPANAPLSGSRFFVNDMNRFLYILNKTDKTFAVYINFETLFPNFVNSETVGDWSCGLLTFAFDPNYASSGKFYTVHIEDPSKNISAVPTNGTLPGFDVTGYTTTAPVNPPAGSVLRQAVLVEWTDTNIDNATFEGTARELLRIGFNGYLHPLGDLIFDPLAAPGSADYGNLYLAVGDGGSGETSGIEHPTPQRLDALQGKILRITPDITLRTNDALSANGRYRIPTTGPAPNPFVSLNLSGLKPEIFSYGHRNPHRLSWDPVSNKLIACEIGLESWEEVNFITTGANYGWAEREGIEQVFVCNCTTNWLTGSRVSPPIPFPNPDTLTVTGLVAAVTPVYPVAEYSHQEGDAMSSGFVYRGSLMPGLNGKFIFGDITTARLFYCNLSEMIAASEGTRTNVAPIHELQVVYNGTKQRLFDVVAAGYSQKGGNSSGRLPGYVPATNRNDPYGVPYGYGRADIRLAMDGDGELYILSKADGMIRKLVAEVSPPTIQSVTVTNGVTKLTWTSISNNTYRVQFSLSLTSPNWTNLTGDVSAIGSSSSKTDAASTGVRFYRVLQLP